MQADTQPSKGAHDERRGFATRLRQALHAAGYPNVRSSEIARQYITRSTQAVSPQSVRKWLDAETLPRQHHINCLATWLNCDPGWLRYGIVGRKATIDDELSHQDVVMLNDLTKLDSGKKQLVRELVDMLALMTLVT